MILWRCGASLTSVPNGHLNFYYDCPYFFHSISLIFFTLQFHHLHTHLSVSRSLVYFHKKCQYISIIIHILLHRWITVKTFSCFIFGLHWIFVKQHGLGFVYFTITGSILVLSAFSITPLLLIFLILHFDIDKLGFANEYKSSFIAVFLNFFSVIFSNLYRVMATV